MAEMFDKNRVQPWINSLQELIRKGSANDKNLIELEDGIQQIGNLIEDFSNLKYALDVSVIVAATDTAGKIIYANDKFCELSKYSRAELIGKDHRILNSGFHDKSFFQNMWESIKKSRVWEGEVKNRAKDGTFYWVKTTIVPLKDKTGLPFMHIAIRTDISEGKLAQEKLVTALQNDFRHVVNSMHNLIFKIERNYKGLFTYKLVTGKLAEELDLANEKMNNKSPHDVFPNDLANMLVCKYEQAFLGQPISYNYPYQERQLFTYLSPIFREDKVVEVIGCINDISELHKVQGEVEFMAYHDLLTSLPNRRKLCGDLDHLFEDSRKTNRQIALFFLDLDRFKQINDSLGHTVGDQLIKEVSYLLRKAVGAIGTIYRLAGDEFIIIFPNIDKKMISTFANQILSIFKKAIILPPNLEVYITCSIGISLYPDHGENQDSLLKNADAAMYAAKTNGRNSFEIYEPAMNESEKEVLLIEHHLRKAIDNNELDLYFQPKVNLFTREINGMEALLRWNSPLLGNVPPDKFIPIAEECGFIIELDKWVMERACQQNKEWNHKHFSSPIRVAVNISPLHFRLPNFHHVVQKVLEKTGLEPNLLEVEITESSFIDNTEECITCLNKLREMGVTVAIDDFGKGYSSLNYLRKLPIHALKIDRSFIQEVTKNRDNIAIVRAITYIAHELNLKVVAEGIETQEVIEILEEIGCDEIQGYYVSEPLPSKDFETTYLRLTGGEVASDKFPALSKR
ncbi:EAL domain-containing protein [Bacillus sp. FJAT-29790]|uniref:sensor domain-containing protein n=1 Tax=Bacillus sp. FJAT-29790 TaxID=1895002 RepID=UPI001C220116|nr:EAL domain-containing protein [Bacillus sp. FJAT-29790]MBU8878086.1 EAL domain-containing protein [Bacillus sp. FJAT-29790]